MDRRTFLKAAALAAGGTLPLCTGFPWIWFLKPSVPKRLFLGSKRINLKR